MLLGLVMHATIDHASLSSRGTGRVAACGAVASVACANQRNFVGASVDRGALLWAPHLSTAAVFC